jgi:hypothetical protein
MMARFERWRVSACSVSRVRGCACFAGPRLNLPLNIVWAAVGGPVCAYGLSVGCRRYALGLFTYMCAGPSVAVCMGFT